MLGVLTDVGAEEYCRASRKLSRRSEW